MKQFNVSVGSDHISALARARKPVLGMLELIWNALDADATRVRVTVTPNPLRGVETIEVDDNGEGIDPDNVELAFGQLGDSWKKQARSTKSLGRALHGKRGVGRYRALALGDSVVWETRYRADGRTWKYTISLDPIDKRKVTATTPVETQEAPGTRVRVHNITARYESLAIEGAKAEVTEHLALYLRQYPNIQIQYDGHAISPGELIKDEKELSFEFTAEDGTEYHQALTILEWKVQVDRALFLCSEDGFSLRELPAGIHAPGLQFTAYLRSKYIEILEEQNSLDIELGNLGQLTAQAREKLREYNLG